jgi:hypothetical protein
MTKTAILAFGLAPLVAALLFATITNLDGGFTLGTGEYLLTILLAYAVGLTLEFVLALPTFLLLKHFGVVSWWSALAAGYVLGYVGALIIRSPSAPILRGHIPIALIGPVSGIAFWLIERPARRRGV